MREIDDGVAGELLQSNPDLYRDENGEVLSDQAAARRLKRQVHARVWTKVQIAPGDTAAGAAIRLPTDS